MHRVVILLALLCGACVGILPPNAAQREFIDVARHVEPVAEAQCRARNPQARCTFKIVLDMNPNAPPNAFQTVDRWGQPVVVFTARILDTFENRDEMAFVMSHEVAHHILGHLDQQRRNAQEGAEFLGTLVSQDGGTAEDVANAQYVGAIVGARSYSKTYELQADSLGSVITHLAGFSPSKGLAYFNRIPDPGDQFLGTHPANPERILVVKDTIRAFDLN